MALAAHIASAEDEAPQSVARNSLERAKYVLGITDQLEDSGLRVQDTKKILTSIRNEFVTKHSLPVAASLESRGEEDPVKWLDRESDLKPSPSSSVPHHVKSRVESKKMLTGEETEYEARLEELSDNEINNLAADKHQIGGKERLNDLIDRNIREQEETSLDVPTVEQTGFKDDDVSTLSA